MISSWIIMSHIVIPEVLWMILIRAYGTGFIMLNDVMLMSYDVYDHKKRIIFFIANGTINLYIGL